MSAGWQLWKSVAQLAVIYPLSARTIQRYIREGKFGVGPDFVLDVSGEFFVSGLGDQWFRDHHTVAPAGCEHVARNRGELVRKVEYNA